MKKYRWHLYVKSIKRIVHENFVPRLGDELRLEDGYVEVIKIVWCMDEFSPLGIRVNIDTKFIKKK